MGARAGRFPRQNGCLKRVDVHRYCSRDNIERCTESRATWPFRTTHRKLSLCVLNEVKCMASVPTLAHASLSLDRAKDLSPSCPFSAPSRSERNEMHCWSSAQTGKRVHSIHLARAFSPPCPRTTIFCKHNSHVTLGFGPLRAAMSPFAILDLSQI